MFSSIMAAENCVCDQKHKEQKRQSHGAEEVTGWKGEGFSQADCGCKFWEETERKDILLTGGFSQRNHLPVTLIIEKRRDEMRRDEMSK